MSEGKVSKRKSAMSLLIHLTPAEEAQLSTAARQTGLAPEALAEKLVRDHLPEAVPNERERGASELDAKLRQWQAQDHTRLMPTRTAAELFAEWDEEAARMTEEERQAEDHLWADFQMGINETRAHLGMRQL